ncbi:MAG: protein kinase [Nitrospira sp.]|nr:protein kinase [Nitrospira sp.]MCC7472676.1 protein kinase [Candidatus Nomurabacteria bacterium]
MTNQVFSGKYIVQDVLAKGGMGVIYKALDRTLNRIVAIKVVHEHLSGDPSFTERFLREARAMARLDHQNIVTIHAVEEERGTPYIVMEYLSGSNLRAFMQARKPVPVRTSVEIALQVAEALAYAHHEGIVHRDIKPANILVDSHGRVKITDFGIAAALDEVSITTVGQVLGTPEYMSPEQASGGKVDGRADLYSLGIVLHEMVVGHHPFGNLPKTVIQSQLHDTNQEIRLAFPDHVPSSLKAIIEDLVRRDRDYRTPTARLLVSQLKECLHTLPPSIEPTEEERTILVTPHPEGQPEQRMPPPVSSEAPYRSSSPFTQSPLETTHPPQKSADEVVSAPLGPEDKTDVHPQHPAQRKPESPHVPQPFWQRYNVLPLVAIALAGVLALVGIILYVNIVDRPQPPDPPKKEEPLVNPPGPPADRGTGDQDNLSTGETPEPDRKVVPSPPPQLTGSKGTSRPSTGPKTIAPSRQQLDQLLSDFQTAYERQDLSSLQRLSDISPDRQMFLDMMSNNYSLITTSIQDIEVRNNQATATLIHEQLIDKNGEKVAPDQILRSIRIRVRKDGDHWSKVLW